MLSAEETADGRYNDNQQAGPSSSQRHQNTREELKKKSLQVNGYGDGESRRKAWLQLLDLEDIGKKLPDYVRATQNDEQSNRLTDNADVSIPLDNEGWQIASHHLPSGSYDEDTKTSLQEALRDSKSEADKPPDDDEWSVATSKRTRRRRRQAEVEGSEFTTTNGSPATVSQSGTSATTPELISRETSVSGFPRISHDDKETDAETARDALKAERKARKRLKRKGWHSSANEAHANSAQNDEDEAHQYDLSSSIVHVNRDPSSGRDLGEGKKHKDEDQVALDIRRSFIGLGDIPLRIVRRKELSAVIVGVLRRHPALNYYQGYHDVVSVLLCVMVPHLESREEDSIQPANQVTLEAVVDVACRLSLHFLRDAMTENMTPTLGHLKVLRDILRHRSSQEGNRNLAKKVEQAAPLPYFALPWLLSMFAHELDISLAQLVFDYVLARGPASVLYVSAALIEQFQGHIDASDAAEMHHNLSQLPTLITVATLPSILEKADSLAENAPILYSAPESKPAISHGVMGRRSVLYTWSSLSHAKDDWQTADQSADAILHGDSKEIVLNALPTPPVSEVDGDDYAGNAEAHIKNDKALVSYKWWRKGKKGSQSDKRKQILRNNTAILAWVGAFGAMSAAALIILYGGGGGGSHTSFPLSSTGGIGSAFPAGLRVAEPLRVLLRNALQH
ncbi:uncharacterized protein FA14DRAFT_56297 [Meira miltonrushii]|uniref:Rab-GAP TBC domain-containing protein n=1 Tax=Meira miltonrushii TaxID=1280837 RepID=A0A316V6K7_9BASI|nr:uncharacterized protein FA14DRAFT_56297 [Meira miltonrushii]PWN33160.1 hypothetical protein FA14DRAFT_56297 [Meira miltonrushii]